MHRSVEPTTLKRPSPASGFFTLISAEICRELALSTYAVESSKFTRGRISACFSFPLHVWHNDVLSLIQARDVVT